MESKEKTVEFRPGKLYQLKTSHRTGVHFWGAKFCKEDVNNETKGWFELRNGETFLVHLNSVLLLVELVNGNIGIFVFGETTISAKTMFFQPFEECLLLL